jgi:hypothetical protein
MKKKGEFKAARARHIAKQELYDAIKLSREVGESWVNLGDKRLHLKSADFMLDAVFGEYNRALVMTRDGGILLGEITDKDGVSFFPDNQHFNYKQYRETGPRCHKIQYGDIVALVIEEHPRSKE